MTGAGGVGDLRQTGRVATFVDAGFLLAAAAIEVLGDPRRDALRCDYRSLVEDLRTHVSWHSGEAPALRTYWYDAAPQRQALPEHRRIAALPYVKLRLGHLSPSGQKGVDVLMYHDLVTLARERALARAYLIAGDEDLREAVAEVQRLGVQVVLLGMPMTAARSNQSASLVRECDEHMTLPHETWAPHCTERGPEDEQGDETDVVVAREVAREQALQWSARVDVDDRQALFESYPHLPREVDIALIHAAEAQLGTLRSRPDIKTEMRSVFWRMVKHTANDD